MKINRTTLLVAFTGLFLITQVHAEVSIDWLYDFRHTTDPRNNPDNYPVIELKLFQPLSFGSFLMKDEINLNGQQHNASKVYTEMSQSIKLGDLKLFNSPLLAHLGFSGGLGLFDNANGGYYIQNAYSVGLELPFEVRKTFCNVYVALRYTNFAKPSYDPMLALYAGKYFLNYKLLFANSLEAWTTSNNQGEPWNQMKSGKFASWELESELWYKVAKNFWIGTYVRTTFNVYAVSNRWLIYPSAGVRYSF